MSAEKQKKSLPSVVWGEGYFHLRHKDYKP